MNHRIVALSVPPLVGVNLAMITAAVRRYPAFWSQAGAKVYVIEAACALVAYGVISAWIAPRAGERWAVIERTAILFGCLAAAVDILGLLVENGLLLEVNGPSLQICVMAITFVLWMSAAWRVASRVSTGAGQLTAVLTAGICAILSVTAGFAIELFLSPPAPEYVISWGEYQRSGWSDPRAFGVANTLDSGFGHLCLSIIVAAVFGWIAAALAASLSNRARAVN